MTYSRLGIALGIALTACQPPTTINTRFAAEIATITDPEALEDLKAIGNAPADKDYDCWTELSPDGHREQRCSSATSERRVAACITSVAAYRPPPPAAIADHVQAYSACLARAVAARGDDLIDLAVDESDCQRPREDTEPDCRAACDEHSEWNELSAGIRPMADKYAERCNAEGDETAAALLAGELGVDLADARRGRDDDSRGFGGQLLDVGAKLDLLAEHGGDAGAVAKLRADLAALRSGIYGSKAMTSVLDHDPIVVQARTELDPVEHELAPLRELAKAHATDMTAADRARLDNLLRRSTAIRDEIAAVRAALPLDDVLAREKAYAADPDVVRTQHQVALVERELASLLRYNPPHMCTAPLDVSEQAAVQTWVADCLHESVGHRAGDERRAVELLAERHTLDVALGNLGDRYGVHWALELPLE